MWCQQILNAHNIESYYLLMYMLLAFDFMFMFLYSFRFVGSQSSQNQNQSQSSCCGGTSEVAHVTIYDECEKLTHILRVIKILAFISHFSFCCLMLL